MSLDATPPGERAIELVPLLPAPPPHVLHHRPPHHHEVACTAGAWLAHGHASRIGTRCERWPSCTSVSGRQGELLMPECCSSSSTCPHGAPSGTSELSYQKLNFRGFRRPFPVAGGRVGCPGPGWVRGDPPRRLHARLHADSLLFLVVAAGGSRVELSRKLECMRHQYHG